MELAADVTFLPRVEAMVAQVRTNPYMELEVRLGSFQEHKFEPGVSPEYSAQLYRDMTNPKSIQACWSGNLPVLKEFMYVYFEDNVRGRYPLNGVATFERVRKIEHIDLLCPERAYGLRVALKEEVPLPGFSTVNPAQLLRCNTRC